jgi:hypothetical protein
LFSPLKIGIFLQHAKHRQTAERASSQFSNSFNTNFERFYRIAPQFVRKSFPGRFDRRGLFFNHIRMADGFDFLKQAERNLCIVTLYIVIPEDKRIVVFTFLYRTNDCAFTGQCSETLLFGKESLLFFRVGNDGFERLSQLDTASIAVMPVAGMRIYRKTIRMIAGLKVIITQSVTTFPNKILSATLDDIFEKDVQLNYFDGEENVQEKWKNVKVFP